MAKKTSYALKQLIPEENPKTGTKYIVRKPKPVNSYFICHRYKGRLKYL